MKTIAAAISLLSLAALSACGDQSTPVAGTPAGAAPLLSAAPGRGLDGQYIVVLDEGADPRAVAAIAGATPRDVYTAALNGFSAGLNAGQLNTLRHHPDVAYVEQDQEVQAVRLGDTQPAAVQNPAPWGLDRIDQRSLPLDGQYGPFLPTGNGIYAYVIDTGINPSIAEFGGRVSIGYDAIGGNGQDCHGRGTDVAAVIGGTTYGVAKAVRLVGVRVLNCTASGTTAGILAGIDWVRLNHVKPAVAHLSLSGGVSSTLNAAVNNLANSGVFVAVAAGDNNQNACNFSPASAAGAMAVTASTITDARAAYSNFGSCADIYAPGSNIPTVSGTRSGTAMAAAHVAGAAVLFKASGYGNATSATLASVIKSHATSNKISGNPTGTPNLLLYVGSL